MKIQFNSFILPAIFINISKNSFSFWMFSSDKTFFKHYHHRLLSADNQKNCSTQKLIVVFSSFLLILISNFLNKKKTVVDFHQTNFLQQNKIEF